MIQEIKTDRLVIRPRSHADFDACLEMDRDPDVTHFIEGPWKDLVRHRQFLEERMNTQFDYPLGYWSIFTKEDPDVFLGWFMALPLSSSLNEESEIEIGWRLARGAWGRGVGTEASLAVINTIQKHYPGTALIAEIHPDNVGSINVALKLGMTDVTTEDENNGDRVFKLD